MYCSKCGKKIDDDSKFCEYCGEETQTNDFPKQDKESNKDELDKPKKSCWIQFLGIIVAIIAFALGRFLGLTFSVLLIPVLLGWYLASWYSKRFEKENGVTKFIAWINTASWFIPAIGFFTSLASINFSYKYGQKDKKYFVLGIIGLVLSLINALIGAVMAMN